MSKDDFKEAYRVFTDRRFELLLRNAGQKEKALYKGLSKQPVTFQHVEEFLIGNGKKDPVKIELKADQNSFMISVNLSAKLLQSRGADGDISGWR